MGSLIYYLSPLIGFVFMLSLIMAMVRKASGRPLTNQHKYLLFGSLAIMGILIAVVSIM